MLSQIHYSLREFNVLHLQNLSSYLSLPSGKMFDDLLEIKQEDFKNRDRIVFYLTDSISSIQINDLLSALQKNLTLLDIPNFFVLIATNQTSIKELLVTIQKQYSFEETPIGFEFIDCPVTTFTGVVSSLVNPPESICIYPWIGVDISQLGNYRPCCFYSEDIKDEHGNYYNVKTHSIDEVYLSDAMRSLRQEFRQGQKPDQCKRCWFEERAGNRSKRQLAKTKLLTGPFNTNWEEDDTDNLQIVSVGLGITCNIKCRICSPNVSSSVANEVLLYTNNKKAHPVYQTLIESNWVNKKELPLWNSLLNQAHLKCLDFSGGEPMLSKSHFKLLEALIAQKKAKDISMHYNTNGTVLSKNAVNLWSEFKLVHIDLSIDNIGSRFEFERSGGKWADVLNVLAQYQALRSKKFRVGLHLTVNIQNAYYLPEICDWAQTYLFDDIHFNLLRDPAHMSLDYITPAGKTLVLEKLSKYKCTDTRLQNHIQIVTDFLNTATTSDGKEFCHLMKILDTRRNESFSELYPEIAKAMGYH